MNYPFFKEEKFGLRTQTTFVGNKLEAYIPMSFFAKTAKETVATELGDRLETMGLFWFKVDGKDWYELQLPLQFEMQYSEKRKEHTRLKPNMPEDDYMVYVLHNGDAFVYNVLHRKELDDLKELFLGKMVEGAKLPKTIPYTDALQVFLNAMQATEIDSLGVCSASIELLLSEMYRNKKNLREPFRMSYTGLNPYDYRMVRITKLPELNSTFTSLIGEDINNQLVASILRKREGVKETESPIEKILKY